MIHLYLLCFVLHRAKELGAIQRLERNADLPEAGDVLKLFTTSAPGPSTPFQGVHASSQQSSRMPPAAAPSH